MSSRCVIISIEFLAKSEKKKIARKKERTKTILLYKMRKQMLLISILQKFFVCYHRPNDSAFSTKYVTHIHLCCYFRYSFSCFDFYIIGEKTTTRAMYNPNYRFLQIKCWNYKLCWVLFLVFMFQSLFVKHLCRKQLAT